MHIMGEKWMTMNEFESSTINKMELYINLRIYFMVYVGVDFLMSSVIVVSVWWNLVMSTWNSFRLPWYHMGLYWWWNMFQVYFISINQVVQLLDNNPIGLGLLFADIFKGPTTFENFPYSTFIVSWNDKKISYAS